MIKKYLIIGVLVLLLVGGVCFVYDGFGTEDTHKDDLIVKNPATGETWNSIKEYEHRDLKLNETENNGN